MTELYQPYIDNPTSADADSVAQLKIMYVQEFVDAGQRREIQDPAGLLEIEREYLGNRMHGQYAFLRVVRAGSEVVGFLSADTYRKREKDAYLGCIIIAPSYRDQGWGGRLYATFESTLPPGLPVTVDAVGVEQSALTSFYERLGFVELHDCKMIKDRRMVS